MFLGGGFLEEKIAENYCFLCPCEAQLLYARHQLHRVSPPFTADMHSSNLPGGFHELPRYKNYGGENDAGGPDAERPPEAGGGSSSMASGQHDAMDTVA